MKLLRKTSGTYLIISGSVFVIAGIVIYLVISLFFKGQLDEKLLSDRMTVIRNIEKYGSVPSFYPFIEVKGLSDQPERSVEFSDTIIFDINENENVPFRQVSSVVSINSRCYLIIARDTLIEKSDMLMTITISLVACFILLYTSLYFINKRFSLKIWQPFYNTLADLRRFSYADHEFSLSPAGDIDEFAELNITLYGLTSKVISDYQSLKRFTEDASHEIQSPLAVIQSKLESLMQYRDLTEPQADLIKSAYSSVQRISKLAQALLLLTKIANNQFPEKRQVNVSEMLEEKLKLFEDQINSKSLTLRKEIEPECNIETNLFLLESLIMNLAGNAVRHTSKGGVISIKLDRKRFEIWNSGFPFSFHPDKLFERFFKANPSTESLGLGLSIVREICSLNKWKVSYAYDNEGHRFTVTF
jgi:signal transduction histidine kinase